jgi:hypothetical protein
LETFLASPNFPKISDSNPIEAVALVNASGLSIVNVIFVNGRPAVESVSVVLELGFNLQTVIDPVVIKCDFNEVEARNVHDPVDQAHVRHNSARYKKATQ